MGEYAFSSRQHRYKIHDIVNYVFGFEVCYEVLWAFNCIYWYLWIHSPVGEVYQKTNNLSFAGLSRLFCLLLPLLLCPLLKDFSPFTQAIMNNSFKSSFRGQVKTLSSELIRQMFLND
ncbi:hypothetical protein VU01_10056 [Candidatus Electrothrix marina]|uniref:Uncharacterized protein n=1 Tax=Candidatus Electrothrix marina TaxID=1859130 RepID=A0A444JHC9_9BACT|nr:hypothetical protein VU01_10056 [Candidatus Electrothrix marina]